MVSDQLNVVLNQFSCYLKENCSVFRLKEVRVNRYTTAVPYSGDLQGSSRQKTREGGTGSGLNQ